MRYRMILWLVALALGCALKSADAAINYLTHNRQVNASVATNETFFPDSASSAAVGVFNATASISDGGATATATLLSDLAPNKITMSGLISALSDGNHVSSGSSSLVTTFTLPIDHEYTSVLNSLATNVPQTHLHLHTGFGIIPISLNSSGTLPAGFYDLTVGFVWNNSFGIGLNEQAYEFALELAPVPEPSSAAFVGLLAIGGIAASRRRPAT